MDYSDMLKRDLIRACKYLGIDYRGNKPALIHRLKAEAENEYELISDDYRNYPVPKRHDVYYRCKSCDVSIPSLPSAFVRCKCGNIHIDIDVFRMGIEDFTKFETVRVIRT
jgi:hypothetical protein